jgi:hypothetical protein
MVNEEGPDSTLAVVLEALEFGILSSAATQRWLDAEILRRPDPPSWLLDASLARDKGRLRAFLRAGGPSTLTAEARIYLLTEAASIGALSAQAAIEHAFSIVVDGNTSEAVASQVYVLDELLSYALEGWGRRNPQDLRPQLAEFGRQLVDTLPEVARVAATLTNVKVSGGAA